ncbi:potassium-transporting ATPase subunit B, partial [Bacillus cytotoxicus]
MRPVIVKGKHVQVMSSSKREDGEVRSAKTMDRDIVSNAFKQAVLKLNPKQMIKNPIMFVVEIGFFITLLLSVVPSLSTNVPLWFNITVTLVLLFTVFFANFAEALAEGRGKAQADSLKQSKKDVYANIVKENGEITRVLASNLKKGDMVLVKQGEMIPGDGEVIRGLASVDESAITGESAPVMKEAGGDFCSVTGGTMVVSDEITIRITSNPGESFLDKMILLVEGATRQKTPNEIALNTVLISLTLIFLIAVVTLPLFTNYLGFQIDTSILV